jgi:general secretion pathway protein M
MTLSESSRRQAFVSYAVLATAFSAVMFAALTTPIRERAAFFASLESQRTTYTKSLEALARSQTVSAQFELRQTVSDVTSQVFHAETPALAGAELQNQLNGLVAAEGGMLLSSAFRDLPANGPLTPIAVTVRVRSPMEALLKILHGLENRSPVLLVESVNVQARLQGGGPQRESDGDLEVELEVLAFLETQAVP